MRYLMANLVLVLVCGALLFGGTLAAETMPGAPAPQSGVIRVKSAYGVDETITRVKDDIAKKGIRFFDDIDQAKLAKDAGITLAPSHLLLFGNPPLGIQFLTANPYAGLDWPVRMLVLQDPTGQVWIAYTDFATIAHRHGITDRADQFKMASMVAASIAAAAEAPPAGR